MMDRDSEEDMSESDELQLDEILGHDPAPFESLLSNLMSSSNLDRSEAESVFNLCKNQDPDSLALKLANILHSSPSSELRAMSAILLRKQLSPSDPSSIWRRLSPSTHSSIKSLLLSSLRRDDSSKSISRKLCDTVAELASALLPDGAWPDLLPLLLCSSAESPRLHESALLIFARLSQFAPDCLLHHLPSLHSLFLQSLSPSAFSFVRIAALSAAVSFIQCLSAPADLDRFQDLLPPMMQTLSEALNSGQESTAQEALELLVELAGAEPRFLRKQLADVVGTMLQIAEAEALEDGTRHLAIEFVISLAEARERAPGMIRKLPEFVGRMFAILMKMLLDLEDDQAWQNAETEEEDGETSNYSVGQECLDRLAISLGGNTIVPVAAEFLPVYLSAPEWQKHHAALITLAQIAEGCSKVMIKNLEQVVTMVLNSFQHPHPRVRWAAINAIGQLSTDLGPDLQVQYHQQVLPALTSAMDDFQNPRVQAHAASAVLNFSENCTSDILTPYLDGIVNKLLILLQNGKQMVQEGALTALASVADSSQEHFKTYYDVVMPYLKAILMKATDKSNRMLRAKSMECISLVGMAVGKEKFRDDAKQVMEVLMTLQGTPTEADDPTASYMLQAWTRLCKCLGQDFLPYMSVVMPPLLRSAQLKPDVIITSVDSDDDMDESDDESIETITLGDKRIGIKTSVLEEKATACNMLCCYAEELKEGFYPWIDEVAPTLVPLLKFYFHEEVRKAAISAMPELLRSAKLAVEKGLAQGQDESYVKWLSDYIIPALVEALHKEPETEICANMLDSLNECIQISGPLLDESQVRSIVDEIKRVITASSTRKRERAERAKAEDFDAEEGELLKEEDEQEEEVFDQVGECLGTLLKTFKAAFLPFFDELSSYITLMAGKDKSPEDRRIAICIFDDVAEQCREAALRYYETYLPLLMEACNDEDTDVRQAAAYGIGICAEFGGSGFKPLIGEALSRLNFMIREPNALHPDNVMAYDNAVSALGKICQFHRDSIDASQVLPAWLSCLPIKADLMEAKVVHDQLCSMVERSDMELLGPDNQYLPKIVCVFAEVLCAGKDLATEQTTNRMIDLLRQLRQTLPPSFLASTLSSLQPQQQLTLQSILS